MCVDCCNTVAEVSQVQLARQNIIKNRPGAFDPKVSPAYLDSTLFVFLIWCMLPGRCRMPCSSINFAALTCLKCRACRQTAFCKCCLTCGHWISCGILVTQVCVCRCQLRRVSTARAATAGSQDARRSTVSAFRLAFLAQTPAGETGNLGQSLLP